MSSLPFSGLPDGHFKSILCDPPWPYKNRSVRGGTAKHYEDMTINEILALPVASKAKKDAHLWLWITWPMFRDGFHKKVMDAWGFRYVSEAIWIKTQADPIILPSSGKIPYTLVHPVFANGYRMRKGTELLLLGERGKPRYGKDKSGRAKLLKRNDRYSLDLLFGKQREHSQKPEEQYEYIEKLTGGPYLELFARGEPRDGWTFWGKEVGKKDTLGRTFKDLQRMRPKTRTI